MILHKCPSGACRCLVERKLPFMNQVAIIGNYLKGIAWISSLFGWDSKIHWILRQEINLLGNQAETQSWRISRELKNKGNGHKATV